MYSSPKRHLDHRSSLNAISVLRVTTEKLKRLFRLIKQQAMKEKVPPKIAWQILLRRLVLLQVIGLLLVVMSSGVQVWLVYLEPDSKNAFWVFSPFVLASLIWFACEASGCFSRDSDSAQLRKANLTLCLLSGLCLAMMTAGLFLIEF